MVNEEHVALLKQGVDAWNEWRRENGDVLPDLSYANLSGANLNRANLNRANLQGANLERADLREADLQGADLHWAKLFGANLTGAVLIGATLKTADLRGANMWRANLFPANLDSANLSRADLSEANLREAFLGGANLSYANLTFTNLVYTNFSNADLTGCWVFGASAWDTELQGAIQKDLLIGAVHDFANIDHQNPSIMIGHGNDITVDGLEIAQFIYVLLANKKIKQVIDAITSKAVLILGRFTPERKAVLDALREELRKRNLVPILFDFEKPAGRDITETISLLARMSRFIVADITDAKSIPQELGVIVPDLPSVPVQPLLLAGSNEYSMFEHFRYYPWVLPIYQYPSPEQLIADLSERVIRPAEIKVQELRGQVP